VVRGAPPSVAEDLAQEAFVRIVKAAKTFDEDRGRFRPWLFKVAKNLLIYYLRENANRQMVPLDECEVVARAIPEDVLQLDKYVQR
jgi:RNA polymerase sigma factor (sigma-70 family)